MNVYNYHAMGTVPLKKCSEGVIVPARRVFFHRCVHSGSKGRFLERCCALIACGMSNRMARASLAVVIMKLDPID